jgi:hypothetical protein
MASTLWRNAVMKVRSSVYLSMIRKKAALGQRADGRGAIFGKDHAQTVRVCGAGASLDITPK